MGAFFGSLLVRSVGLIIAVGVLFSPHQRSDSNKIQHGGHAWRWLNFLVFIIYCHHQRCTSRIAKEAITSKLKHAMKRKTSPARFAQLLQPSLASCYSLIAANDGEQLKQNANEGCNSCSAVVQVLQDLF